MATWEEIQREIRAAFDVDDDHDDELALTLTSGDRAQRVMLRRYASWGRTMIEIRSAFSELGDYEPEALLADNLNLPLGAVALHGDFLVLVQRACLDDQTASGVIWLVRQVGVLADLLEARTGVDRF